jgi:hypothetical protein
MKYTSRSIASLAAALCCSIPLCSQSSPTIPQTPSQNCMAAVNYSTTNTVVGYSTATTSVVKSAWSQCASEGSKSPLMYFDLTARDIPTAIGGWDPKLFGRNPSITPTTAPVLNSTIGPPLKPGLVFKDNSISSTDATPSDTGADDIDVFKVLRSTLGNV